MVEERPLAAPPLAHQGRSLARLALNGSRGCAKAITTFVLLYNLICLLTAPPVPLQQSLTPIRYKGAQGWLRAFDAIRSPRTGCQSTLLYQLSSAPGLMGLTPVNRRYE